MRINRLAFVALSLSLGVLAGGACSPEDIPHTPTFAADVEPIMLSRCVRCHGAGGTLNDDPDHTGPFPGLAPIDGYFDRLEDICPDGGTSNCKHGLLYYVKSADPATPAKRMTLVNYIHSTSDASRMPPPPTPKLTTRQIQVIDAWMAEDDPR
jgi:mono/diheme cytochrome c family protein